MSKSEDLFQRSDKKITFDGVDLEREIANIYGTPTYVFSERKLKENISTLKNFFTQNCHDVSIVYSLKNNFLKEIISIIANELDFFEISSLSELKSLEQINLEKGKEVNVIATNIYKSNEFIESFCNYPNINDDKKSSDTPLKIFAIDSFQDLKNVETVLKNLHKKADVLIRVNPGLEMDISNTIFASATPVAKCASIIANIEPIISINDDPTIADWLPERKNIPLKDTAENLIREASKSNFLNLIGIHCHLGSQITNLEYYEHFFAVITHFFRLMNDEVNNQLQILDIGGGYPVKYLNSNDALSIEAIAKCLSLNMNKAHITPKVLIESGRFITASAGILLSKVHLTKEISSGRRLAVLDLSIYSDLLDVLTANWYYEAILVSNLPSNDQEQQTSAWDLVGETNDILDQLNPRLPLCKLNKDYSENIPIRIFPRDLAPSDLIAIKNAGAYTTCFNSQYNGRQIPNKYIIKEK